MIRKLYPAFLVVALVFLAYGQTLGMYFWQDDSALIFKLQNPEGPAGSFGKGLWERGAYQYLVVPFVPFFKIFGLEPLGYFAIGFLTYLIATVAFYLFAQELLKNKKAGFIATLVFAAGYVGSDTMFRIINSWQTNIGITLALLTFWIFTKYLREGGLRKYFLSVAMFLATIEIVFIRSHSLILPILALDVLLRMIPFKINDLPKLILRQTPFWFLWQQWYLQDASFGGPGLRSLLQEVIFQREIVKLSPFLANIGNSLVPDIFQTRLVSLLGSGILSISILILFISVFIAYLVWRNFPVSKKAKVMVIIFQTLGLFLNLYFYDQNPLWYRDAQSVIAGLIGIQATILILFTSYLLWRPRLELAIALTFGLFLAASQFFGYYTQYPTSIFHTTHRYFSHSFIGYSILFGGITYLVYESFRKNLRWFSIAPLVLVVGTNLILGIRYQSRLVEERSLPSRKFYQDLKTFVPNIEKGAAFYFDVASEPFYQHQFGDFFSVGSMPESTALAIYYGVDRYDLKMLTNFDELAFKLYEGEINIDNLYTFFYGPQGLLDTIEKTRKLLENGSDFADITEVSPLTPVLLKVEARISQAELPEFPYQYGSPGKNYSLEEKLGMFGYLKSRKSYYRSVKASSVSEWKFREVRNLVDGDPDSVWQGHRIWWHENGRDEVTVDLGEVKNVSRAVWQNWNPTLAPTSYEIEASTDGNSWQMIKKVENGPERRGGEFVIEDFKPTNARFIRMNITQTLTDDSPAILEFEAVEAKYQGVNPQEALEFAKNPFAHVASQKEWNALYSALDNLAEATVNWETDKKDIYLSWSSVPISLDGKMRSYEVVVPAGGTTLREVKINTNFPARVTLDKITARNLSLKELKERGLIIEFREN